jgi:hypothetical protein
MNRPSKVSSISLDYWSEAIQTVLGEHDSCLPMTPVGSLDPGVRGDVSGTKGMSRLDEGQTHDKCAEAKEGGIDTSRHFLGIQIPRGSTGN